LDIVEDISAVVANRFAASANNGAKGAFFIAACLNFDEGLCYSLKVFDGDGSKNSLFMDV
jgi:hypothetical protein